jgi:hypothetical protein
VPSRLPPSATISSTPRPRSAAGLGSLLALLAAWFAPQPTNESVGPFLANEKVLAEARPEEIEIKRPTAIPPDSREVFAMRAAGKSNEEIRRQVALPILAAT